MGRAIAHSFRYIQRMAGAWREIEQQLAAYNKRKHRPLMWALGSIALMLVLAIATHGVGLLPMLPLAIGLPVAIVLSSTIGVRCPACKRLMNDIGARGAGPLMLLVNLKQCPLCQHKFDDAA